MGTFTTKLGLTKPFESDVASINDINANMDIIDGLVHTTNSGTAAATKYAVNSTTTPNGVATWYWELKDNGRFTMHTTFDVTDLKTNEATASGVYRSGYVRVKFPTMPNATITAVTGCQAHVSGNVYNWVINQTGNSVISYIQFLLAGTVNESTPIPKKIYIEIKGTWS